jgi:hypothetical protein
MPYEDPQAKAALMEEVYPDVTPAASEQNQDRLGRSKEEILTAPLDSLIDMEIASMVANRQRASEDWRRPRRMVWDQAWLDYKQVYNSTNKQSWQSTTYMPLITRSVEVIVANMHGAIMGPDVPIEWQSRGRPDLDEKIHKHNKIVSYDFEKSKFKAHWTDFLRGLTLLGTSVGKVEYLKQTEEVMVKERRKPSMMDQMLSKFGKTVDLERFTPKNVLVKDYATFKACDLYDIYPQPYTEDFGKDYWCIEKGLITNKELIDGSLDPDPYYRLNIPADLLMGSSGRSRAIDDPEKQVRRLAFLDYDIQSFNLEPDMPHEILKYYGPIPTWFIDPELRNDAKKKYDTVPGWIWVVDNHYVVRKRISPWRDAEPPYVRGNYIRVPGQFYGIGVGELLAGLQVEKNEIRNLNIDNINITMNKIVAVLKDKVPANEWKRIESSPGAIWTFEGIDDVRKAMQTVEFPDQAKSVWMATQQIDQESAETSGAVKATLGIEGGSQDAGGSTFRGQLLNKQVATERFMLYARVLEVCGLGDAMKKYYQRIYQFKSYKEIDEILGPVQSKDFELISPEDLEKVASLVPLGVLTMENKGVKLAQMERFSAQWMMEPWFKKWDMARKEWIEMGFPDADSVVFSPEEMVKWNQFKQSLGQGIPGMPGENPMTGNPGGPIGGPQAAGMPLPAMPATGPGVKPSDMAGMPVG